MVIVLPLLSTFLCQSFASNPWIDARYNKDNDILGIVYVPWCLGINSWLKIFFPDISEVEIFIFSFISSGKTSKSWGYFISGILTCFIFPFPLIVIVISKGSSTFNSVLE